MKNEQLDLKFEDAANDQLFLLEMKGYFSLKMKTETLRLARYFLEKPEIDCDEFLESIDVVLAFAGKSRKWLKLAEVAYRRVRQCDREQARSKMLLYCYWHWKMDEIRRYIPKRITHQTGLLDLMITWQFWQQTDRMDKMEKTVSIMAKAIQTAASSRMSAWLSAVYAKFWSMKADLFEDEELENLKHDYLNTMNGFKKHE